MDELIKMIDKLVESKTFDLSVLGEINKLRERAMDMEKRITSLNELVKIKDGRITQVEANLKLADGTIAELKKKEADLAARERAIFNLELSERVANAKFETATDIIGKLLANRMIRESCYGASQTVVPPPYQGGSYETRNLNDTKTTDKTEV